VSPGGVEESGVREKKEGLSEQVGGWTGSNNSGVILRAVPGRRTQLLTEEALILRTCLVGGGKRGG